jgi:DNA helicase HerA-like ATPase
VFFFDEAHMLFDGTAKALVDKIEMVVRLIRSKGVGVYFVTQNPTDVPDAILSQLGNRVQHALRAFTPKDQKAVKAASETFRANPDFKTIDAITELGTGEALVSFLDEKGTPAMVQRAKILFPLSQIGAISDEQRSAIIKSSQLYGKYETAVDRESAYEKLQKDNQPAQQPSAPATKAEEEKPAEKPAEKAQKTSGRKSKGFWSVLLSILTPIIVSLGKSLGREVIKSATGKTTTRSTSTRSTSTRRKTTSSRKR